MIAIHRQPVTHLVAQELLLRATAIGLALAAILGLLPVIVGAAA